MIEGLTEAPTAAMLASVIGIATIVAIVMNLIRPGIPADFFTDWAPSIACVFGVGLALLGAFERGDPEWLDAAIVGLFGGWASQHANSVLPASIRERLSKEEPTT